MFPDAKIVERARSTGALSHNSGIVSMETAQLVLDLYQTFHPYSVR